MQGTISRRRLLAAAAGLGVAGAAAPSVASALTATDRPARRASGFDVADPFPTDRHKLQHLLRRTTFGPTPADMARYKGMPLDDVVDALLDHEAIDDGGLEARLVSTAYDFERPVDLMAWWLTRMTFTTRPLLERMCLFWHGLLTSGLSKVGGRAAPLMIRQNDFFRAHAFDHYDTILKGISRDGAMMIWLDIHTSTKEHPNENYARELMELFSLGVGNYTEDDVREAARAYTGYALNRDTGEFVFRPARHDFGEKTFLGQTGPWDGDDIVDIILQQPAAEQYLARRLWRYFAYPNPEPEALDRVAQTLRATNFDVGAGLRAVLTSDYFYSPQAYRAIVRAPVDLVVSAVRLLGIDTDGRPLARATHVMGQDLFNPPNVAGWPGGAAWLGTSIWFARVNAAAIAVNGAAGGDVAIPTADPMTLLEVAPKSAESAVDSLATLLVDGQLSDDSRAVLIDFALEGVKSWPALSSEEQAERMRGLLVLLLASPEYQLA